MRKGRRMPEEEDDTRGRTRQDNSLSVLTKKFIQLIKNSNNFTIDLNDAAVRLGVPKRRIYDITNVLQGIEFVSKTQKNIIRWVGGNEDPFLEKEAAELKEKLEKERAEQRQLDKQIAAMSQSIRQEFLDNQEQHIYRYITHSDIQNASKAILKDDPTKSLIIVSAPKGSTLEAGEDQGGTCLLRMNSFDHGNIKVFICKNGSQLTQLQPKTA